MNEAKEQIKQKVEHIRALQKIELDLYNSIIDIIEKDLEATVEEGVDMEPFLFDVSFNDGDLDSFWDRFIHKNV